MRHQNSFSRFAMVIALSMTTLLSCASHETTVPSYPEPFSIDVEVRDASGKPVESIPVSISSKRLHVDGRDYEKVIETLVTDETGRVRFEFSSARARRNPFPLTLWVRTVESEPRFVVLEDHDDGSVSVQLPPMGDALIQVPENLSGRITLMNKRRQTIPILRSLFYVSDFKFRLDGQTRIRHIGLGQELAYRIDCLDNCPHILGSFQGPRREGETSKAVIASTGRRLITGRLFDEDRNPLSKARVSRDIRYETETFGFIPRNRVFDTDSEGRFKFTAYVGFDESRPRLLSFSESFTERENHCRFDGAFEEPSWGLGDLTLASPASSDYFASLEDDILQAKYQLADVFDASGSRCACLSEMSRRGGERWIAFIKSELERVSREKADLRAASERRQPSKLDCPTIVPDLEYLTFLRRAEGRDDPIALTLDSKSVLKTTFSVTPIAVLRLTNRDPGGEFFFVTDSGTVLRRFLNSMSSGYLNEFGTIYHDRFSVFGGDDEGDPLEQMPSPKFWFFDRRPQKVLLAPGQSIEFAIPISKYVDFKRPGRYRVQVYFDHINDFQLFRSMEPMDGPVEYPSLPLDIEVRKGRIELTLAEATKIMADIDCMRGSDEWEPPSESAIKETGLKSVPFLLDALGTRMAKSDHERIMNLLFDLYPYALVRDWDRRHLDDSVSHSEKIEDWLSRRENFETIIVDDD